MDYIFALSALVRIEEGVSIQLYQLDGVSVAINMDLTPGLYSHYELISHLNDLADAASSPGKFVWSIDTNGFVNITCTTGTGRFRSLNDESAHFRNIIGFGTYMIMTGPTPLVANTPFYGYFSPAIYLLEDYEEVDANSSEVDAASFFGNLTSATRDSLTIKVRSTGNMYGDQYTEYHALKNLIQAGLFGQTMRLYRLTSNQDLYDKEDNQLGYVDGILKGVEVEVAQSIDGWDYYNEATLKLWLGSEGIEDVTWY